VQLIHVSRDVYITLKSEEICVELLIPMVPCSLVLLLATIWRRLVVLTPIVADVGQSMCLVSSVWCRFVQRLICSPANTHDTAHRLLSATSTRTTKAQADEQCKEPEASSSGNDGNLLGVRRRRRSVIFVNSAIFTTKSDLDKILVGSRRVVSE